MKIAASDYDGTLFRNNEICSEDVKGVADWRARGNKFGVVSGRDYGMLAPQLHHYGIGYDYAVCNNGGIILDAGGKVLQQEQIPGMTLRDITRESCVRRSMHFAFSAADCTYLCHEHEGSWITREAKQWDFPIIPMREEDILKLPTIHQFSLGYADPQEATEVSIILNEKYGTIVHAYPNRGSVDITPCDVSKKNGILHLLKLMHWERATVYTIGDETNDLPMIEAFLGFTVSSAREVIRQKSRGSYTSVGAMLEDNL
jgi:Cof subfamily protein (haloacid dehalogenase superfamily)